ncbi:MAG TPA: MFS transporter [Gaiellaceae bacterium]|nr:MFS transporter [Gaiellaceae bacterium]
MTPQDPTSGAAVAPAPQRLLRLPTALREREFRRFWTGETISLFGDQITLLALPLVGVLALDASPAQMGYLGAASLFPGLLFSLHAGAWVDRRGKRRQTMIATALGRAALLATIPLAYWFDLLTLAQLYVVSFLVGTLSVVFFVSYSTLFVSLVKREHYLEANSLLNGSRAFSYIAGPSVGGLLVQAFSAAGALVVDTFSFLASALALSTIDPVEPPTEKAERGHVKAGIRYIRHSAIVRSALLATATINFFNFVFWALFILYVTRSLDVTPGVLGLILGSASVGGLIGSVVTGRINRRIGAGPAFALGCVLFPVPLVLVPLAGGSDLTIYACLFAAEFLSGFGVMVLDITAASINAALIPDRLRARVAGAYMLVNYGVRPLGSLLGGALGTWIGLRETLWIGAVGATLGVIWLLPSPLLRLRELPEPAE